jgi:hypothetical protein
MSGFEIGCSICEESTPHGICEACADAIRAERDAAIARADEYTDLYTQARYALDEARSRTEKVEAAMRVMLGDLRVAQEEREAAKAKAREWGDAIYEQTCRREKAEADAAAMRTALCGIIESWDAGLSWNPDDAETDRRINDAHAALATDAGAPLLVERDELKTRVQALIRREDDRLHEHYDEKEKLLNEISLLKTEVQKQSRVTITLQATLATAQASNADLRAEVERLRGTLATEEAERIRCRDGWVKSDAEVERLKAERDALKATLAVPDPLIAEWKDRADALQAEVERLKKHSPHGYVHRAMYEQVNQVALTRLLDIERLGVEKDRAERALAAQKDAVVAVLRGLRYGGTQAECRALDAAIAAVEALP